MECMIETVERAGLSDDKACQVKIEVLSLSGSISEKVQNEPCTQENEQNENKVKEEKN